MQVGLFTKSDWIRFPGSGSVVELVLYNKDAFSVWFPEKGILRRLVVTLFPEGGVMVIFRR